MDVDKLDALPDNRKSGFWKLSWGQVIFRVLLWAIVVYINEKGWVNPHDPNFLFADYKMKKWSEPLPAGWYEKRAKEEAEQKRAAKELENKQKTDL